MINSTEKKPQLTSRQKEIYEYLKDKILNRGYGPTVREIGTHFGIRSPNGVMCHLKALEKKGLITRESHMSRAIQLADPPQNRLTLKYAGRLTSGGPIRPSENGDRVNFAPIFDEEDSFCLRIEGSELADSAIADGDYVVVARNRTPQEGDMVVTTSNDGRTNVIKHDPIASNYSPVGVVISVIRRMD